MKKILLIKTSSLGDLLHTLPALSDVQRAMPNITIDWLVEERFVAIPNWHPMVRKAFPVAIRRWRKNLLCTQNRKEIATLIRQLKAENYDLIIDAQGLMKTIWPSWFVKAKVYGYAFGCARDKLVPLFYKRRFVIGFEYHAVERIRRLFSSSLSYSLPSSPANYGIDKTEWQKQELIQKNYILLFTHTTWENKHWPKNYWVQLINYLIQNNYHIKLSWGSAAEQKQSQQLASYFSDTNVSLLPDLNVMGLLPYIASAKAVIAVDTGLGHLAAALNIPTVGLFGPTDPAKTGIMGPKQISLSSKFSCAPCLKRKCSYNYKNNNSNKHKANSVEWPACFTEITPKRVLATLLPLLTSC